MARDCLLSSFLLSHFDDAPGMLLLLSHLEPAEEQTPHSSFPRPPPSSLTAFLIPPLFFLAFTCLITLPHSPIFFFLAKREKKKGPFIVLKRGLCSL